MSTTPYRRIIGIIEVEFKLINKTGLLIRSPLAKATIGGADIQPMFITRNYNGIGEVEVPYIPGSSLKGRMRGLLEVYEGSPLYSNDGKIYMHVRDLGRGWCNNLDHSLDNLFGSPSVDLTKIAGSKLHSQILEKYAPTRLIVEDIYPSHEYVSKLEKKGMLSKEAFIEEKSENRIDRITSAADPRTILRVRPDVEFTGSFKILLYDVDYKNGWIKDYVELLLTGMKLLEDTYLGGSGTRGYGKVVFKDIVFRLKTPEYYRTGDESKIIELGSGASTEELLSKKDEIVKRIMENVGKYVGEGEQ